MGYVNYYLIVYDFIRSGEKRGYSGGAWAEAPAREASPPTASASRALTRMRYDLLFERFLNPERVSMPDFDVDFSDERRQEIIDYVMRQIRHRPRGADRHLRHHGGARLAIRDVGRAMAIPYTTVRQRRKACAHGA